MSSVKDWSTTAASNGAFHFPELQNHSTVNDDARQIMAEIKEWYNEITAGTLSGTVGGTADAITLTLTPTLPAYVTNTRLLVKVTAANTVSNPTINVSALGAKTIVAPGGAALPIPGWATNDMLLLIYDGTNFVMVAGTSVSSALTAQSAVRNAQTGTTYTVVTGDRSKYVTFNNASPVAVTLPSAASIAPSGWYCYFKNLGAGTVTITPTTSNIGGAGGTALVLRTLEWAFVDSDGTNYDVFHSGQITGLPSVREHGTRGIPQSTQNGTYTFALSDAGSQVYHSSASAHTWTIPANSSVAFPVGSVITLVNDNGGGNVTVAITTDTLRRGDGTAGTGSRTLGPDAVASLVKITSTSWMITGAFS